MKGLRRKALELAGKKFFVPAAKIFQGIGDELANVSDVMEAVDKDFVLELKEDREKFLEGLVEEFCSHTFFKEATSTSQLYSLALSIVPTRNK